MSTGQGAFAVRPGSIEEMLDVVRAVTKEESTKFNRDSSRTWFMQSDGFMVAECDGKLVGAVSFSSKGIAGKQGPILDAAMVLRDYRRRGIATELCVSAIAKLVAGGHTPIHCTVLSTRGRELVRRLPCESSKHLQVEYAPIPALDLLQDRPANSTNADVS